MTNYCHRDFLFVSYTTDPSDAFHLGCAAAASSRGYCHGRLRVTIISCHEILDAVRALCRQMCSFLKTSVPFQPRTFVRLGICQATISTRVRSNVLPPCRNLNFHNHLGQRRRLVATAVGNYLNKKYSAAVAYDCGLCVGKITSTQITHTGVTT